MRIETVEIKNLGVLAEATLRPTSRITLVLGTDASGKSTTRRALELLIRGDVADLEGSQAYGAKDLLGPADTVAYVAGMLSVGGRTVALKRILAGGTFTAYVNGKPATKDLFDFFSPTTMRDPAAAWRTLLNASAFFGLDALGQQRVLGGLIEQAVPPELLAALPIKQYMTAPTTLDQFAAAYSAVFGLRTNVNRQRKDLRVPAAPADPREDVKAIGTKLSALRSEEVALVASVGEGVGLRKAAERRRDEANRALAGYPLVPETDEDATRAVSVARTALEDAKKAEDKIQGGDGPSRGTLINRRDKLTTALAGLKELRAACVIHSDIGCPLSMPKRQEFIHKWEKDVGVLGAQIETLPAPATSPLAALERALVAAEAQVASIAERRAEHERLERELAAADGALAATPVVADPPTLIALRQRIATGEDNLALAREINKRWDDYDTALAKSITLTAQADDLDALVAAFGAKGIGGKLLAERLGALVASVNGALRGFQMVLTVSSEPWAVKVNGRHPVLMSASERFRAGVALQIALAEVTGARWVLIDGADVLGTANRSELFGLLLQAVGENRIEQAIVTATTLLRPSAVRAFDESLPDDIEVWWIAEGKVVPAATLPVEDAVEAAT